MVFLDNLNMHILAAFYLVFEPGEVRRLTKSFTFHYKLKPASWLHMIEIELNALIRPYLDRRIPNKEVTIKEVKTWQDQRKSEVFKVHWQFTTADTRVKLKRLCPKIGV